MKAQGGVAACKPRREARDRSFSQGFHREPILLALVSAFPASRTVRE